MSKTPCAMRKTQDASDNPNHLLLIAGGSPGPLANCELREVP